MTGAEKVKPPRPDESGLEVIAFDADDTLWHSEIYFESTQRRFNDIVARHVGPETDIAGHLFTVEHRNLVRYGYGIKAFTLSMVEAAIEITGSAITSSEIDELLAAGRTMLDHPVDLLDGVQDTVTALGDVGYRLAIITKGDLNHQQNKIAASGLADHCERLEIVSEKDPDTYRQVTRSMDVPPAAFAMVGNSLRSDVLPVIAMGGHGIHVPYHVTWAHEHVDHDGEVTELASIRQLADWLASRSR